MLRYLISIERLPPMMSLHTFTANFIQSEHGAVTVDMVPLMAATVALGLAVGGVVSVGVEDVSTEISTALIDQDVTTGFVQAELEPAPQPEREVVRIRARVNR